MHEIAGGLVPIVQSQGAVAPAIGTGIGVRGPVLRGAAAVGAGRSAVPASAPSVLGAGQAVVRSLCTVARCGAPGGRRLRRVVKLSAGRLPTQGPRIPPLGSLVTTPSKHVPPDCCAVASSRVLISPIALFVPRRGGVVSFVAFGIPPAARNVTAVGCLVTGRCLVTSSIEFAP